MASGSLSFDDGTLQFLTEDGYTIFGPIRGAPDQILTFSPTDGTFTVDKRYDEFSPTSSNVVEEHTVFGIIGLMDLSFGRYVIAVSEKELAAKIKWRNVWRVKGVRVIAVYREDRLTLDQEEHEASSIDAITSLLISGNFYFSVDVDLTNGPQRNAEKRAAQGSTGLSTPAKYVERLEERFLFNSYLLKPLLKPETFAFILPLICGYVGSTMLQIEDQLLHTAVISRCSKFRAGPSFRRGIDSRGDVAVEVESEVMVFTHTEVCSYRMIRGSLPLMWGALQGNGAIAPKLETRDAGTEKSLVALRLHLEKLTARYGPYLSIVDLLDASRPDYEELGKIFEKAIIGLRKHHLSYHHCTKSVYDKRIWEPLQKDLSQDLKRQGIYHARLDDSAGQLLLQKGIFRINDLECIDATNYTQYQICKLLFPNLLLQLGIKKPLTSRQLNNLSELWASNGDALSMHYTGAPALYRDKICSTWLNYWMGQTLTNVSISLTRSYMAHLQADTLQEAFTLLVGPPHFSSDSGMPLNAQVQEAMDKRKRVILHEAFQNTTLASLLLLRRLVAPKKVKSTTEFAAAIGWLGVYVLLHQVGAGKTGALLGLRRQGSGVDLSGLPNLPGPMKGNVSQQRRQDVDTLLRDAGRRSGSPIVRRKMSYG
ncbi:hypothetical protein HDV05_008369 [Chytridiales sp. JEL 0842]|nr:hypothetical protein HDV05_008369 [Chytridiales sp. JEL 0842]